MAKRCLSAPLYPELSVIIQRIELSDLRCGLDEPARDVLGNPRWVEAAFEGDRQDKPVDSTIPRQSDMPGGDLLQEPLIVSTRSGFSSVIGCGEDSILQSHPELDSLLTIDLAERSFGDRATEK